MIQLITRPDHFYAMRNLHFTVGNIRDLTSQGMQKSRSRQRSGNGAIRKKFPLQKPRWEKIKKNNHELILREHIVSRTGSHFPNRWQLSHPNLTKILKFITAAEWENCVRHVLGIERPNSHPNLTKMFLVYNSSRVGKLCASRPWY